MEIIKERLLNDLLSSAEQAKSEGEGLRLTRYSNMLNSIEWFNGVTRLLITHWYSSCTKHNVEIVVV